MGTANTSQFHYLARLQFLKKRYQETEDPKEKRRIGSLLDGEEDCVTLIDCVLVQSEMEKKFFPLVKIPPLRGGDFQGRRIHRPMPVSHGFASAR